MRSDCFSKTDFLRFFGRSRGCEIYEIYAGYNKQQKCRYREYINIYNSPGSFESPQVNVGQRLQIQLDVRFLVNFREYIPDKQTDLIGINVAMEFEKRIITETPPTSFIR
jgi:hypothetical protein